MILTLTAINEPYISICLNNIDRYKEGGWDIIIQTNQPDRFNGYKVVPYNNTVFSYFDKLLFPFKISLQTKENVVNIDADDMHKPSDDFVFNFQKEKRGNKILYPSEWPVNYGIDDIDRLNFVIDFWKQIGFDYTDIKLIWEWLLYVPYNENLLQVIFDIEYIKPAFEYGSLVHGHYNDKAPIGSEEGLALAYSLKRNGIKTETFKPCYLSE